MNTIVVCTDFSPNATIAAQYGARIAADSRMKLLLCHSFPSNEEDGAYAAQSANRLNQLKATLMAPRTGLSGNCDVLLSIATLFVNGSISDMADVISDDNDNFLILMGTHSKGRRNDVPLGNSVNEMIDRSDIPVLLIPPSTTLSPIKKFAFATDLEAIDRDFPAFYRLVHVARLFAADILLTHIYYERNHSPVFQKWIGEFLTDISNKANYGRIYYKIIKSENTDAGLDLLCDTCHVDVLVMVHRQEQLLQHSYSKEMAARIRIPLLVIPCFAE